MKDTFVVFMNGQLPAFFNFFYERKMPSLMPMQVGNRVWRLSITHAWQHFKDIRWGIAYRDSDTIGKLSMNAEAEFRLTYSAA